MRNFAPIGSWGWERDPQNGKNFHLLVKSRTFSRFQHLLGLLYAFTRFTFDTTRFTGYRVIADKPRVSHLNGGGVGIRMILCPRVLFKIWFGSFNASTPYPEKRGFSLNAPKNVFRWWVPLESFA